MMNAAEPENRATMAFWDHLEELRRIIFCCLAVLLPTLVAAWFMVEFVTGIIQLPLAGLEDQVELVLARPLEGFMARLKMSLATGLVLAAPAILFFLWRFVAPGLYPHEIRTGRMVAVVSLLLFMSGAVFAFFLLFFTVPILAGMGFDEVRNLWSFSAYLEFCLRFMIAFGLVFELPVVVAMLVWFDLVELETLRRGRSYAIVTGFILAALLTPPDPFTQLMLGLPLVVAYEIGLLAAKRMGRRSCIT